MGKFKSQILVDTKWNYSRHSNIAKSPSKTQNDLLLTIKVASDMLKSRASGAVQGDSKGLQKLGSRLKQIKLEADNLIRKAKGTLGTPNDISQAEKWISELHNLISAI